MFLRDGPASKMKPMPPLSTKHGLPLTQSSSSASRSLIKYVPSIITQASLERLHFYGYYARIVDAQIYSQQSLRLPLLTRRRMRPESLLANYQVAEKIEEELQSEASRLLFDSSRRTPFSPSLRSKTKPFEYFDIEESKTKNEDEFPNKNLIIGLGAIFLILLVTVLIMSVVVVLKLV
jgi:hypothetical protein